MHPEKSLPPPHVVVDIVERALVAPSAAAATTQHALLGEDAPQRDGGPPHPPPQSIAVHDHVASPRGCTAVPRQYTKAIPQVHCPIQEALHRKANRTQRSDKSTTLVVIVVDATDNHRNNQREPKP